MDTDADRRPEPKDGLTGSVLGAAFEVSNRLGHGFLESVYRRALMVELRHRGLSVEQEVRFLVRYRGEDVGAYNADLVVDGRLIVELKTAEAITSAHEGQLINYLRASGLRIGLILNFGTPRVGFRRLKL